MATYGSGFVQGGNGIMTVKSQPNIYTTTFSTASLNTHLPLEFNRVCGPQTIVMTYNNGAPIQPSWQFTIKGGMNYTSSDVLPMFSNTNTNYGVVDYVPDDSPTRGCTISVLPKPSNTTRINVFEVVESVTGLNLRFTISACPFAPVPPVLVFPAPQVALFGVTLTNTFYRLSPGFTTGGIPSSYSSPGYEIESFETLFPSSAGVNPLDGMSALPFRRYNGQQTIVVTNTTTGFFFSFDIDYGIINQGNGYFGFTNPTTNAVEVQGTQPKNCTITNTGLFYPSMIKPLEYTVVALDGRTYIFTFDPNSYTQAKPTIRLSAGPLFGVENVTVESVYLYFSSV